MKKNAEMKSSKLFRSVTVVILFILLVGCTSRSDRILSQERGPDNRCHMKIETYGNATTLADREVIDYYGPCDELPERRPVKSE